MKTVVYWEDIEKVSRSWLVFEPKPQSEVETHKLLQAMKLSKDIADEESNINDFAAGNEDDDEGIDDEIEAKKKKESDTEKKEDEDKSHDNVVDESKEKRIKEEIKKLQWRSSQ